MIFLCIFWCSLFLIFYSYIGYYLILVVLTKFKSAQRKYDTSYTPRISVIIAIHNEDKIIDRKIKNCLELNYPKDKIKFYFGSDGCTDRTNSILKRHENDVIRPYLFTERRGKACVLNELVEYAEGEILVFSDANTMYESNSIRYLVQHFVEPKIGGVCGKLVLFSPNDDVGGQGETLYWNYENRIKYLEGKIKTVFGANGAIYAIRKNLFRNLPEDKVVIDDFLIPLKIVREGYDVVFEEKAVGKEATSLSFKDEFVRKVRIGASNYNALQEIRSLLNPLKGFVAFGLWSHKVIRWFVPFFLITLFLSNLFIVESFFYTASLGLQLLFYLLVFCGWIFSMKGIRVNFISYIYYFGMVHFALFVGFYKFLTGTQKPTWTRSERSL